MNQEDRRTEYTSLRAEILQSDRTCLLMMGYLFAAVGLLYSKDVEWLASFLSFVSLCYFTEKRFSIRLISSHIANTISQDDSGFEWDRTVPDFRRKRELRPLQLLRPYNVEAITCSLVALSPIVSDILFDLIEFNLSAIFWIFFAFLTVVLSINNVIKFKDLDKNLKQ